MNYTDCINALQEYADAPENAGVDNEFFKNVIEFVKEQEEQINLQVSWKENEKTQRIKLEQENEELEEKFQEGLYVCKAAQESMEEMFEKINELKEENKKLKDKYENFRVRNCNRMEEYVKALSPWKKNHQDHIRILEAIKELKDENKELKEQIKTLQYQLKDDS